MRQWMAATLIFGLCAAPALAAGDPPAAVPAQGNEIEVPADLAKAPNASVTRGEFVTEVASWIKAYEKLSGRSLQNPQETILLYMDLGSGLQQTALDLQKNYRLFNDVDSFNYGMFEPDAPMSRLQALQLLHNVVALVEKGQNLDVFLEAPRDFSDKQPDNFTEQAIADLSARSIFAGFPDKTFRADQRLTRRQFEILKGNVLHYLDETVRQAPAAPPPAPAKPAKK